MKVIALDNNGETFDRYTIIDVKTGDMIGASDRPFAPNGFGQFAGNIADNYWNVAYGYAWRKNIRVKKAIKFAVDHFLSDCAHVGKVVEFISLPEDVQKFANQSFN